MQNFQENYIPVIAIDGPTASGKGTIANKVAKALNFHYLDSGIFYRLIALASYKNNIHVKDEIKLKIVAEKLDFFSQSERIILDKKDVTNEIRSEIISKRASEIATSSIIREILLPKIRNFRKSPGLVSDGRDIGSVVFPNSRIKIFLTADLETRAQRRYKQLISQGISGNIDAILEELDQRDVRDSSRCHAPLKNIKGSHYIDTTNLSINQTVEEILNLYKSRY